MDPRIPTPLHYQQQWEIFRVVTVVLVQQIMTEFKGADPEEANILSIKILS
jgi:hypothetical protein